MNRFDSIDGLVETHDHADGICPDCGTEHPDDGLGSQFLDMVLTLGFDHPVSQNLIKMGLTQRGVNPDTIDFDSLTQAQLNTLIHNLALGTVADTMPVAKWNDNASHASVWLTKQVIDNLTDTAFTLAAIRDTDGIGLAAQDAAKIIELIHGVVSVVGSTVVYSTNPLNPLETTPIPTMSESDFEPVTVGEFIEVFSGGDAFRVAFEQKVADIRDSADRFIEVVKEQVASGEELSAGAIVDLACAERDRPAPADVPDIRA